MKLYSIQMVSSNNLLSNYLPLSRCACLSPINIFQCALYTSVKCLPSHRHAYLHSTSVWCFFQWVLQYLESSNNLVWRFNYKSIPCTVLTHAWHLDLGNVLLQVIMLSWLSTSNSAEEWDTSLSKHIFPAYWLWFCPGCHFGSKKMQHQQEQH